MTLTFILEATLRTVVVAGFAGLLLAVFRVQSSTVKLAIWRLVLFASLLMPLAAVMVPARRAVVVLRRPSAPAPVVRVMRRFDIPMTPRRTPIDWRMIGLRAYLLVAGIMALRTALGLLRLRQLGMTATPMHELGPEVFETSMVTVPVTYGFWRQRILLPVDWRTWSNETLSAVLAHERAHIAERDFLTQCLSKLNRTLYWANPLSWWLDRQLAQLAEHSSDDAALNRVGERPTYAAVLLHFAERRSNLAAASGVAMARPGGVAGRIDRILDDAHLVSQPLSCVTRATLGAAAFVAVIAIGACRMSTVSAQSNPPQSPSPQPQPRHTEVWWTNDGNEQEWALITPHGTTMMNGHSSTIARAKSFGARTPGNYIWFTRDGKEYLIDEAKTMAEIQAWFAPIEELGRQQGELGEKQGKLGEEMGKLGEEMSKLSEEMSRVKVDMPDMNKLRAQLAELNKLKSSSTIEDLSELQTRLGDVQALIGEAQSLAGEKQGKIGELQGRLGEKQGVLGEQQGMLGELQGQLGERQGRLAEEAEQKLRKLFDEAIRDGRAKPVR